MQSKRTPAGNIALGGILAAMAVVIMNMGTLIPVATYACPMLCVVLLKVVLTICGSRIAWAWFGAVAILSALMAPDKESAAVFAFLGYYPIVKPWLDRRTFPWLWKGGLFNIAILVLYWMLIHLMGLRQITAEYEELGTVMTAVLLVLGNVTFFLLDRVLEMRLKRNCK